MNTEKTYPRTLTPRDKIYIGSMGVVASFAATLGAYTGHLWIMVAGILLMPIAFIIRFPRRAR